MGTRSHPNRAGQRVTNYDAHGGWLTYCPRCRLAWKKVKVVLGRLEMVDGKGLVLARDDTQNGSCQG